MERETAKKPRPTLLHVDLKDLKAPWADWCEKHGLTPSEAVRRVLGVVLNGRQAGEAAPTLDGLAPAGEVRRRVEIRLTEPEHAALTAVASREGMGLPRWLTGVVRLYLTGDQQFGEAEVEALARSSQVLLALGRNVNQIARNMNQRADSDELTLAQIEYLADLIKTHTSAVSALLTANSRRWRR